MGNWIWLEGIFFGFMLIMMTSIRPIIRIIRYYSLPGVTEGVVVKNIDRHLYGSRKHRDNDGKGYWATVYEYVVDNKVYQYRSKIKAYYPIKVGKRVCVRYDINCPERCEVLSKWMWWGTIWSAITLISVFLLFLRDYV